MIQIMLLILLNIFLLALIKPGQGLISCDSKNVTKTQLCIMDENNVDIHDYPDTKDDGEPMEVKTALTLISIAEINSEQNTISLNIILSLFWNDSRISMLKANNE